MFAADGALLRRAASDPAMARGDTKQQRRGEDNASRAKKNIHAENSI